MQPNNLTATIWLSPYRISYTTCDYLAIDYHLSYYRVACRQLTEGIENPKEFARVESIRDAALCAIALEIGIVTEIGSGKLDRHLWEKAIAFIHRYEQAEVAV
jgi:hypothetical protein